MRAHCSSPSYLDAARGVRVPSQRNGLVAEENPQALRGQGAQRGVHSATGTEGYSKIFVAVRWSVSVFPCSTREKILEEANDFSWSSGPSLIERAIYSLKNINMWSQAPPRVNSALSLLISTEFKPPPREEAFYSLDLALGSTPQAPRPSTASAVVFLHRSLTKPTQRPKKLWVSLGNCMLLSLARSFSLSNMIQNNRPFSREKHGHVMSLLSLRRHLPVSRELEIYLRVTKETT